MKYVEFQSTFSSFQSVTLQDMRNVFGAINHAQLADWKQKGYIIPVKRGRYVLARVAVDPMLLANEMNDSYVSLESALSYHQMIPEAALSIVSVSKKTDEEHNNDFGAFRYVAIAPKLYCGYALITSSIYASRHIRVATKEKALFDLVYFRPDLRSFEDLDSLRLRLDGVRPEDVAQYVDLVEAPRIKKRLGVLMQYLHAHA